MQVRGIGNDFRLPRKSAHIIGTEAEVSAYPANASGSYSVHCGPTTEQRHWPKVPCGVSYVSFERALPNANQKLTSYIKWTRLIHSHPYAAVAIAPG
jgi:hypothetical protein